MMQKFQLSSVRFGICATLVILSSTFAGCASPYKQQVTIEDMLDYKINCRRKHEQLAYLQSLMPSRTETHLAKFELGTTGFLTPDFEQKRAIATGRVAWYVKDNIEELQRCPG
jgi:hypothetical protein